MEEHQPGAFTYTAVSMDALAEEGASEETLVTLIWDKSGSTTGWDDISTECLKQVIRGCDRCPRKDYLLVRLVVFDSKQCEVHGYKPLRLCLDDVNQGKYDNLLNPGGSTALYDVTIDGIDAAVDFAQKLDKHDYDTNGIIVVLTDGEDMCSTYDVPHVKAAFQRAVQSETLESLQSILIAINPAGCATALQKFSKDGGFTKYVEFTDLDEDGFAKLADWISESVSSQSQALGTGGPSQVVDPAF